MITNCSHVVHDHEIGALRDTQMLYSFFLSFVNVYGLKSFHCVISIYCNLSNNINMYVIKFLSRECIGIDEINRMTAI